MTKNVGRVVQIIGPVLDIKFENGSLPPLLGAIEIEHEGTTVVSEVAMQLGDDTVRCPRQTVCRVAWKPSIQARASRCP